MEKRLMNESVKHDIIMERDFIKTAKSGDILLFQSKTTASLIQRFTTQSEFDHVAMVIRLRDGMLRVFEAVRKGVSLTEWNKYIYTNT